MTLGPPGPRDWSPAEPPSMNARGYRSTPITLTSDSGGYRRAPKRGGYGGVLTGWLALLLGAGALAIAMVQPSNGSAQAGFMLSSIGVFAISLGFHALHQRRMGLRSAAWAARLGILGGTIGTAAMAYTLVAFLLVPAGIALPPLPSLAAPNASGNGLVLGSLPPAANAPTPAPPADAPALATFASAEEERLALAQTAGTAAFVLRQAHPAGTAWPDSVAFAQDRATLVDSDGDALVIAPSGSQLLYSRSSDGTQFSLTLVGPQYATVVTYDSTTGLVS